MLGNELETLLQTRLTSDLVRKRRLLKPLSSSRVELEGNVLVNFSSSDYLGLSDDVSIRQIYQRAHRNYPSGSSGSSLVTGYHPVHRDCEEQFAEYLGVERAVLLNSGYTANLALLSALASTDSQWVVDKQIHASVYDAAKLAGLNLKRFKHNDTEHLQVLINQSQDVFHAVMVEGVYSMSGTIANLKQIASSSSNLFIDDAHALGVLGDGGRGSLSYHGLHPTQISALVCPLSKAFNSQGAVIAGKSEVIEAILQFSRPFIYATAISPALANSLTNSIDIVATADSKREYLNQLVAYFQGEVIQYDLPWGWRASRTPIQQLLLGCSKTALALSKYLIERGFLCIPMRYPTVTKPETGLRVTLTSAHTQQDIDDFLSSIKAFYDTSY